MEKKEIPPAELSLKYIAWDVKQINKTLEKISDIMLRILHKEPNQSEDHLNPIQEEMPF